MAMPVVTAPRVIVGGLPSAAPGAIVRGQAASQGPVLTRGPSLATLLVLGGLGVGGYFLYRHFKKG